MIEEERGPMNSWEGPVASWTTWTSLHPLVGFIQNLTEMPIVFHLKSLIDAVRGPSGDAHRVTC